jgi:hypothetical protein
MVLRLMVPTWKLAGLLAGFVLSGNTAPTVPPCVGTLTRTESGARAHVAAPHVTPTSGRAGTLIRIRGAGFEPGTRLIVAAVFAENGCSIEGLGDQYLGTARADGRGAYTIRVPWPHRFDPVLGRNGAPGKALPAGRYYVFAMPCSMRTACSFASGSEPGGPFRYRTSADARAPAIASGAAVSAILFAFAWQRRRRARAA